MIIRVRGTREDGVKVNSRVEGSKRERKLIPITGTACWRGDDHVRTCLLLGSFETMDVSFGIIWFPD
jgi:hypothetical protein